MPHLLLLATVLLFTTAAPAAAIDPEVDQAVIDFAEREAFNGVILVADAGGELSVHGFGHADIERGLRTKVGTRYQLGSIAKWVTSIVVLGVADDGRLDLDTPIGKYLDGLPPETASKVTLRHLLSHRSGVPNGLIAAYQADPTALDEPLPLGEAVRRFASDPLAFEPGGDFDYSHSNWILVQAVVESVEGKPFHEVIDDRLVRPLKLENTGVFSDDRPEPTISVGYESLDPPEPVTGPAPAYLAAAGGIYSTALDLLDIAAALDNGILLPPARVRDLNTVLTPDPDLSNGGLTGGYALGGRVCAMTLAGDDTPRLALWHSGSNGPWKTRLTRLPATGETVITMTNADTDHAITGALAEQILALLREPGVPRDAGTDEKP